MTIVSCPRCHKSVPWNEQSPYRPFCSERCKIIDLGAWADGSYAIPSSDEISAEEELEAPQDNDTTSMEDED